MSQAPNISIRQMSLSLLGTFVITGTVVFAIAGLHGTMGQNVVLDTFSQKGRSILGANGAAKSKSISKSGSTYLIEDNRETNLEGGYLHLDRKELGSSINIIANYPSLEKISDDPQIDNNLPKVSMYEIPSNGSIINKSQYLMAPFPVGVAYTTSGYTKFVLHEDTSTPTWEEIEVMIMAMADQLNQLTQDLRNIDSKYDGKINSIDAKLDSKFNRLEQKIDKAFDDLNAISNKLSDKVSAINIDVVKINTKIDINNTLTEKFKIPLITGLIVGAFIVIANHLPDIFKALLGTPKP